MLPALQEMVAAAGPRPMVLINPRLGDIPSAGGVMSVRGREDRLAFIDEFEQARARVSVRTTAPAATGSARPNTQVYHFRLLYRKPFWFPIYGVMRYSHGGRWEIYKRLGRMTTEVYRFAKARAAACAAPEARFGLQHAASAAAAAAGIRRGAAAERDHTDAGDGPGRGAGPLRPCVRGTYGSRASPRLSLRLS